MSRLVYTRYSQFTTDGKTCQYTRFLNQNVTEDYEEVIACSRTVTSTPPIQSLGSQKTSSL
jgi:hypothetical protein